MYKVSLAKKAFDFYTSSPPSLVKKLDNCFQFLKENPYKHNNIKSLSGRYKGFYRYRIGNYRVVYSIEPSGKLIIVLLIEHRSKVYR